MVKPAILPGMGGVELTLFDKTCNISNLFQPCIQSFITNSCVFQVILCYRVRKWGRSNVSYAETAKAARGACQVCLIPDFLHQSSWLSDTVQ